MSVLIQGPRRDGCHVAFIDGCRLGSAVRPPDDTAGANHIIFLGADEDHFKMCNQERQAGQVRGQYGLDKGSRRVGGRVR